MYLYFYKLDRIYLKSCKHQRANKPVRKCQMNTCENTRTPRSQPKLPGIPADSEETAMKQNCSLVASESQTLEVHAPQKWGQR